MVSKFEPPELNKDHFHCPHCEVYAHQLWYNGMRGIEIYQGVKDYDFLNKLSVSICERCKAYSLWVGDKMIYPVSSNAPLPSEDTPEDVKDDYMEARAVLNNSPRASAAVLRLALEKIMPHLGEKGKDLNEDIGNLVKKGLPGKIQEALDAVRVIGNNAVHPGQIDLKDDRNTALALFTLLNMVVEVMITRPKKVDALYTMIPDTAKKAIEERDKNP